LCKTDELWKRKKYSNCSTQITHENPKKKRQKSKCIDMKAQKNVNAKKQSTAENNVSNPVRQTSNNDDGIQIIDS